MCGIAKCGSTLWREVLAPIHGGLKPVYIPDRSSVKPPPPHSFRAMFVRHPLLRLYSAYNDKIVGMETHYINHIRATILKQRQKRNDSRPSCINDVTFEEFLNLVLNEHRKNIPNDIHWTPYWKSCKLCKIPYNFIGKLETFREDINQISEHTKKSGNFSITKAHIGKNYAEDKCRMMHYKELTPRPVWGTKYPCNHVNVMLTRKLESMKNKGLDEESGFTFEAFKDLPKSQWINKCVELVKNVDKDPKKKAKVSKLSKQMRIEAYKILDKDILDEVIEAYKLDFQMFDYDPQTVFQ